MFFLVGRVCPQASQMCYDPHFPFEMDIQGLIFRFSLRGGVGGDGLDGRGYILLGSLSE